MEEVRIDKWLWMVRLFKTRSIATEACKSGRITIDQVAVKPSRMVREGLTVMVSQPPITKTIAIKGIPRGRVGAKLVTLYLDDQTPEREYEKLQFLKEMKTEWRSRGSGRPTKKERREIDRLKED
ncbi:MAG: RNA-binding protein [Bacteroidetes bacterium]|nr:MAG: RNA-binding protein [Bacteroidota bacterium]